MKVRTQTQLAMEAQAFKLVNIITISFWILIINGEDLTTKGNFQALFIPKGELYSKIASGHLHIPINISIFDHRIQAIDQLKDQIESTFNPSNFAKLAYLDKRELKIIRDSINLDLRLTRKGLVEAKSHFKLHHHQFGNRRSKRQILVGLAGIAAGLIYSEITKAEAIKVIQNDQSIIKSEVQENILKISQSETDIKLLNKTSQLINDELKKVFLKSQSNTIKITMIYVQGLVKHYLSSCEGFLNGLSSALSGKLTPNFVNILDLKDPIKTLKTRASNQGYKLSIDSTLELPNLPLSLILNETHLNLLISIPIESPTSKFILYEYVPTPVPFILNQETHYLFINPRQKFIAVNLNSNQFIEMDQSDLDMCSRFDKRFHCQSLIETSPSAQTCLLALYKNNFNTSKNLCNSYVSKNLIFGHKIASAYLLVDTESRNIKYTYNISSVRTEPFSGSKIVTVDSGSSVATKNLFISKNEVNNDFDLDIDPNYQLLDSQEFQTTIKELGIIDENSKFIDSNDSQLFDEIADSLAKVGSKLNLKSVKRIVRFQQKWRQSEIDSKWSIYGNLIIIGSVLTILTLIFFISRCVPWKRCCSRTSQDEAENAQQMQLSNLQTSQAFIPPPQASAPPPTPVDQPRDENPKIDAATRTLLQDTATAAATAALEMRKSKKANQTPTFDDLAYNY